MIESLDGRRALMGPKAQIKEIRARHQAIMRLHILGVSQKDIAQILEITPQMVSIVQNSDIYRAEFSKMQQQANEKTVESVADIQARIEKLAGKSLTVLEEILEDAMADNKIKADVAFDILDRSGYKPAQKVEHSVNWGETVNGAYQKRKAIRAAEATVEVVPTQEPLALGSPGASYSNEPSEGSDDVVHSEDESEDSSAVLASAVS